MTQEEKAKAYDKVREKIKVRFGTNVAEEIFSKFEETENERISKEIIKYLEQTVPHHHRDEVLKSKEWTAWLKKQGESYTKRDVDDAWLKGMCDAKRELEKQKNTNVFDVPKISIKDAVEVTSRMQYIEDDMKPIAEFIMDYANWDLHKDEWNQPTLTVPLFRVLDALIQRGKPYCECSQNIEKQGEQKKCSDTCDSSMMDNKKSPYGEKRDFGYFEDKPTDDKVEPKFHEGEWLCENKSNNYARFIQILETVNVQGKERYRISRDIHNDEDIVEFDFVEKYYHKFDIQDAKDGDVLAFKNNIGGIIICKSPTDYDTRSYCRLIGDNFINKEESGWDSTLLIPATKEQRDALIKAMADAGYEWDAERKELKKIENKNHLLSDFFKAEYERGKADVLKSIAWSEEDEKMLADACIMLDWYQGNNWWKAQHIKNWLKSLKQRIGG